MNTLIDLWCACPTRTRIACWCLWTLSLGALAVVSLSGAGHARGDELFQQRAVLRGHWQELRQLTLSVDEHLIASDKAIPPFSPLQFQVPQARLLYWKPTAQGGEMALKGQWDAVPQIFNQLAAWGMGVSQFSLSVEEAALLLTLQLERPHGG